MFGATTFSKMTRSLIASFATPSITDIQLNDTHHYSIECCYAKSRDYLNVMLSVDII